MGAGSVMAVITSLVFVLISGLMNSVVGRVLWGLCVGIEVSCFG